MLQSLRSMIEIIISVNHENDGRLLRPLPSVFFTYPPGPLKQSFLLRTTM